MRGCEVRRALAIGLVVALGCGSRSASAPSPVSQQCRERVADLDSALARIPRAGLTVAWPFEMLVELDDTIAAADRLDGRPTVIVAYAGGLGIDGGDNLPSRTVAEARTALADELDAEAAQVLVVAHWDAPWSVIATALEALRELGKTEVDLLFVRAAEIPLARPSSITQELQLLDRDLDARAVAVSKIAERIVATCETIPPLLQSVAGLDREAGRDALLAGIGEALRQCDCKADIAAIESLLYFVTVPDFIPAIVRLRLAPKSPSSEVLAFPRDATWLEVHAQVVAARDRPMAFAWQ